MTNVADKQLSWFAILVAAFYSLLASSRGEDCGHEDLARCARPLGKITNNNELGFVTTKTELEALCPDLQSGMSCIRMYTLRCMQKNQRENFNALYKGVNMAIMELCQDSPYQDAFLKHAPCMQKVQADYEVCSRKYQESIHELEKKNLTRSSKPVKLVCCAFQEFLACSHHTVRYKCGEETAEFTKSFLERMSNALIKKHCAPYTEQECSIGSGTSDMRISMSMGMILPLVVALVARYST